ncbi:MAG TPA: FliH/SctL family protein [Xanthobacteraceae bacterium]|nr:FliH/SctL family protein [Xanthobacteraceae bacterium]
MTAWAKFLFDNDFALGEGGRANAGLHGQHQAVIAEAEARGYRGGVVAGKAEAAAETERQTAVALSRTAAVLEQLAQTLAALEARLEAEAVEIAVAVASKLASALVEREPVAEIAALASQCFRHLANAPHIVLRLNETQHEQVRAELDLIAERCNLAGRLIVLADPTIALGDCRIEWADGGAARNRAATESAIAAAVERYLAAGRGHDSEYALRSSTP